MFRVEHSGLIPNVPRGTFFIWGVIMAKLYDKNGWIDFDRLNKLSGTLNIVLAPRNSGKTFGKMLYNHNKGIPYIFMRTTQQQIDTVFVNELSPFEKLNRETGSRYICSKLPGLPVTAVYSDYTENEEGKRKPVGAPVNFCMALLQVGSIRGFNLDYIPELIYDEFVKHNGEIIRNYGKSDLMYFDAIVTLNRARELSGLPPIKQWLFGNTDNLAIPILQSLHLINTIIGMRNNYENYRKLPNGIAIFLCDDSPAAKRLSEISNVAKMLEGTNYYEMAYKNSFVYDDMSDCNIQAIGQYKPVAIISDLMLMEHKYKDLYYIRAYTGDCNGVTLYPPGKAGKDRFKMEYGFLYFWFINGNLIFSDYDTKIKFLHLIDVDI